MNRVSMWVLIHPFGSFIVGQAHIVVVTVVFQLLSSVWLFVTPWSAAHQASLSFIISWSSFRLMSIELKIPSNYFILRCLLLFLPSIFLSIRVFSNFTSGGPCIGASTSVLPMNIQDWFPLGLTGLVFLQTKGLSRVFLNTTIQKYQFLGAQSSF